MSDLGMHSTRPTPDPNQTMEFFAKRLLATQAVLAAALDKLAEYGWVTFGSNVDSDLPLMFSTQVDEAGTPFFERVSPQVAFDVDLPHEADNREPGCVERWPECHSGGYDPRCCRFPKSCSVTS